MRDIGVQVDASSVEPAAAPSVSLDESGFADFSVSGTLGSDEFRCADCGYGAIFHRALPPCPMCGGTVWEDRTSRLPSFAS